MVEGQAVILQYPAEPLPFLPVVWYPLRVVVQNGDVLWHGASSSSCCSAGQILGCVQASVQREPGPCKGPASGSRQRLV